MTRKQSIILGMTLSALSLSLALFESAYNRYYRLPEQTTLETVSLAGMNRLEASHQIHEVVTQLENQPILIKTQTNLSRYFLPMELGIRYDQAQTVERIFADKTFFSQIMAQILKTEYEPQSQYQFSVDIDGDYLQARLSEYLLFQEKDFTDAFVSWENGQWVISGEQDGVLLKQGEIERITNALTHYPPRYSEPISFVAEYEPASPQLRSVELQEFLEKIRKFVETPLVLDVRGEKLTFLLSDSRDWLEVDSYQKSFKPNESFAKDWIRDFSQKFDIAPESVVISGVEDIVSEYDGKVFKRALYRGNFNHGRKINQEKFLTDLLSFLSDPKSKRIISVEVLSLAPSLVSEVEGYEFPQLLSTGLSSYRYGNHPNRVTNIKLSLLAFQGVIVQPGEELSFNRVTGWIIPEKGYTKTQIIEEGRVKEGIGGGVCQSSSTVYRAVLNAGLSVTERRNHTLDVIYYHEYGYGLDATVYTDSRVDLRFVNDFPHPILINVFTDDRAVSAHVEFYGTSDNRRVELVSVPSGNPLLKLWNWKVIWPDREEARTVISRYQLPKEEEKEEVNPLEG